MTEKTQAEQIAEQYLVVAHLAKSLADIHTAIVPLIRDGKMSAVYEIIGPRSAKLMQILGDILNGMDAVDPAEDAWVNPIFAEAAKHYPQSEIEGFDIAAIEAGVVGKMSAVLQEIYAAHKGPEKAVTFHTGALINKLGDLVALIAPSQELEGKA